MGSINSDDSAVNHYEKQLFTVFKSFDVNDAGALNHAAVHELCDSLQLEDRGEALLDTLFEHGTDRVTFAQFRTGLLTVLGAESAASAEPSTGVTDPPDKPLSDGESSGCEVAPRFVFGSKKYGRRSRPVHSPDPESAVRSSSASRLDSERPRTRLGRSASAVDERPRQLDPARRIDRAGALALCHGLSMDGVDNLVERIFEVAPESEPTVGEFFGRLNVELATTIEETGDASPDRVPDALDDDAASGVPVDMIIEAWERAGVPRPRNLLLELGFRDAALRLANLEHAFDGELRTLSTPLDERALLHIAALSVSRLRARLARTRVEAAVAERDKLRVDVAEANARAQLLAQEVDENHARIEEELKASLRRAEARYAEAARLAALAVARERELAGATAARHEAEAARHAEIEARYRDELAELRARKHEADARAVAAEEQLTRSEQERMRLAAEAVMVGPQGKDATTVGTGPTGAEVAACLEALRRENKTLRDRNDELIAELEVAARGSCRRVMGDTEKPGGDLSAELADLLPLQNTEDSSPVSLEQHPCGTELDPPGETARTGRSECGTQTKPFSELELQQRLAESQHAHDEDKLRLEALIKELEMGLEQMKNEYERCEEYWSQKLEQERALHAEETRAGDERLAELLARVRDYELRYAPALPPIDERGSLELQVTELEEEFARYRREKEAELAERERELQRARREWRPGPGPGPSPGPGPEALRARTERAEGAVRRLHARLAAADLLVKELYLENCHLAHRHRHRP